MIIGIMGKAGSGKDAICFKIINRLEEDFTCEQYAFADSLKEVISEIYSIRSPLTWTRDFKENGKIDIRTNLVTDEECSENVLTIRQLLQKVGTSMQHVLHPNVWINNVFNKIYKDTSFNIITDVRFKHEYKAVKSRDGILIRVINPSLESKDDHISENDVDDLPVDYTIINNWKEDPEGVEKQIDELVQQITNEYRSN